MNFLRVFYLFCTFAISPLISDCSTNAVQTPENQIEWESHKKFFQKNGYLWIKDFFSADQVSLLQNWTNEIQVSSETLLILSQTSGISLQTLAKNLPGTLIIVPEAKNPELACRAEDISSCFPGIYHLMTGTVAEYIGQLLEEPYVLYKDKINFKWPGGGAFPPHQDYPAYELFGAREHITAMISIDPATVENGCLYIAQNWKKTFENDPNLDPEELAKGRTILPYIVGGSLHGSILPEYFEKISWVALETSPRDLVIFDSFTPHYSKTNESDRSRRAMFFTHNRLREGEFRRAYFHAKRQDPDNPIFHFGTPTKARTK